MTAPLESWKVLPHGPLTGIDDKVWTVTGTIHMPIGDFERRTTVVRLRDGGLVVYSAIALDEPQMARLEVLGRMANIPGVRKLAMVKDSAALADQLLEWREVAGLRCILLSHGEPIVDDPRAEPRRLSESLR